MKLSDKKSVLDYLRDKGLQSTPGRAFFLVDSDLELLDFIGPNEGTEEQFGSVVKKGVAIGAAGLILVDIATRPPSPRPRHRLSLEGQLEETGVVLIDRLFVSSTGAISSLKWEGRASEAARRLPPWQLEDWGYSRGQFM